MGEGWRYKFNKFCDDRGLPLLFGVIAKVTPLRLITKFHGEKMQSVTVGLIARDHCPCGHNRGSGVVTIDFGEKFKRNARADD